MQHMMIAEEPERKNILMDELQLPKDRHIYRRGRGKKIRYKVVAETESATVSDHGRERIIIMVYSLLSSVVVEVYTSLSDSAREQINVAADAICLSKERRLVRQQIHMHGKVKESETAEIADADSGRCREAQHIKGSAMTAHG